MPSHRYDPGIPTLTQRAEPALPPGADDADEAFPVLTEVAQPAPARSVPLPDPAVLSARLQAEVEQLMQQALADAVEQIQARMDAELPVIVARVLRDVRPG